MTTLLGCIADDFTGATDLAGLLARSGVRVSLRIGIPAAPPDGTSPFEVIALSTTVAYNGGFSDVRWPLGVGAVFAIVTNREQTRPTGPSAA